MESFEAFTADGTAVKATTTAETDDSKAAAPSSSSHPQSEDKPSPATTRASCGLQEAHNVVDPSLPISDAQTDGPSPGEETVSPQTYPHLLHSLPESPVAGSAREKVDDDDEDHMDLVRSLQRHSSPPPGANSRNKGALVSKVGDEGVARMHKFMLYETTNKYYIVGCDILEKAFRFLKIDRTADPAELLVVEDDIVYNRKETFQILNAIDEGNKSTGGLKLKTSFWGLLGFIRFTGPYYMIYVTKRSQVAMVGGHYIYQIDKTDIMALQTAAQAKVKSDKHVEENRFMSILQNLDLSRSFYFSYSYDVTRTLQHNIMREREALQQGTAGPKADHNDMFVWNHHLLEPVKKVLRNPFDWCLAIIHGYVDQAGLSVYWGRMVYVTIIARRSRFFAGARFLKRGANDLGYVANDVETEQIVSEMLTTSFHAPGPSLFANSKYTSYVQHRGSIPLYWAQDNTGVNIKPDIKIHVNDPFFSAAALHFDNLFQRYGTPIYVLNLIKSRERTPRESKLLAEYTVAISYLNQFLPKDKQILYRAWDMSRASKSRDQDVIGSLEEIAEDILPKTGFFQNGNDPGSGLKLQRGVARTNCIDCLDRTNAAQFVIAKQAFGYQLQALGVIEDPSVEYDSDAINLFTHMWHDHGDTIAIQYGGSHLVNTMATYRKINQWTSQSRDMVESFKRYYNNSFMDAQRQEAYNLFLGNYIFAQGQPMLWDLSTDYYLHHADPRSMFGKRRPSYQHWYTDEHLRTPSIPPSLWPHDLVQRQLSYFDDYWVEYYRPLSLSSFKKLFSFKMHSNLRYIPISSTQGGKYDLSPFKVRTTHDNNGGGSNNNNAGNADQGKASNTRRKGVKIIAPSDDHSTVRRDTTIDTRLAVSHAAEKVATPQGLGHWLDAQQQNHGPNRHYTGIIKETSFQAASATPTIPKLPTSTSMNHATPHQPTKAELALQSFTALVANSLSPTVPETEEYQRYVAHPSTIPLVVSSKIDYSKTPTEFLDYLSRAQDPTTTTAPTAHGDHNNNNATSTTYHANRAGHDIRNNIYSLVDDGRGIVALTLDERAEASLEDFAEYVDSGKRDDPLTVFDDDLAKKRYKAYRQWLRGKSLFKQRPLVGGEVA